MRTPEYALHVARSARAHTPLPLHAHANAEVVYSQEYSE